MLGIHFGKATVKDKFDADCKVPNNYCDPSIKALELELKGAFATIDKYYDYLGEDKKSLVDGLETCQGNRNDLINHLRKALSEIELWSTRAEQMRSLVAACSVTLETCNENLRVCSNQLDSCANECILDCP